MSGVYMGEVEDDELFDDELFTLLILFIAYICCLSLLVLVYFIFDMVQSQFNSASWSFRYFIFDSAKANSILSFSSVCSLLHTLESEKLSKLKD